MKYLAFFNNKGGVGKTTTVINVAYTLGQQGKRVLVVDCDGQQNAARFLCDTLPEPDRGLERVLLEGKISPLALRQQSRYENISVLAATPAMNDAAAEFAALPPERQKFNLEQIREWDKPWCSAKMDYVLLDLPPAMNALTSGLLSVSDGVIVPIELSGFSLQGIARVTDLIAQQNARFIGCFVSKMDRSNSADVQMLEMLRSQLGQALFDTTIPQSKSIKNSISYRLTVAEYMHWIAAAKAYQYLTNEILRRA